MLNLFVIIWVILFLSVLATVVYGFPAIFAVGPIAVHRKGVEKALELAKIKTDEKFYDLGCGDGRVLIKAVKKYNCFGIGYELVFPYYLLAKMRVKLSKKSERIDVRCKNFFKADLHNADVIFCFLSPMLMQKLGEYLKKQKLKKGTRIISYAFKIDNLEPKKFIKRNKENWNIYLYEL